MLRTISEAEVLQKVKIGMVLQVVDYGYETATQKVTDLDEKDGRPVIILEDMWAYTNQVVRIVSEVK